MPGIQDGSTESRIIELLSERCAGEAANVVLGIGDDAAITAVTEGHELVVAVDALVEGTHFLPGNDPCSLGHRSLATNISDLAAMGAQPRWALLTLALPAADESWVAAFANGFAELAERYNISLIGGDTVRGPLSISVTLLGTVPKGQGVLRSGARPGDIVYLTGHPGWAAAWREVMLGKIEVAGTELDAYRRRFEFPEPRLEAGQQFAPLASAMIDISDGVHTDLSRLLQASDVGAELNIPPLGRLERDYGEAAAIRLFLSGGEDYELCFTAAAGQRESIAEIAGRLNLEVTAVGELVQAGGVQWYREGVAVNPSEDFALEEFSHFQD